MTSTKLNLLLLPLLVSILLSVGTKLKVGQSVDTVFYTILTPIHAPVGFLRRVVEAKISTIKNLPQLEQNNKNLISQNAQLLFENEQLKQRLGDTQTSSLHTNFKSVLPVRLTGSVGSTSVASSLPLDQVKPGQPLVYGKILLGLVSEVKGQVINITSLDSDRLGTIAVHTNSGQKGQYRYQNNTPQITDIPSLAPIIFGDYVFTEPGELIPGNLVIGKITKIISAQQEPLQKAQIKLDTSLRDVSTGLVILLVP